MDSDSSGGGSVPPPASLASIKPKPCINYVPDASGGGKGEWPENVEGAANLYATFAVSGTVTSVGPEELNITGTPEKAIFGVGVGQHAEFVPDGAIATTWVEDSWSASYTSLAPIEITSVAWLQTPIAHVDADGQPVDYNPDGLLYEDELMGAPPGLVTGNRVLLLVGIGHHAHVGSTFETHPTIAAVFPIQNDLVVQADGSTLTIDAATELIEAAFDRARLDYAATRKMRREGP